MAWWSHQNPSTLLKGTTSKSGECVAKEKANGSKINKKDPCNFGKSLGRGVIDYKFVQFVLLFLESPILTNMARITTLLKVLTLTNKWD